MQVAHKSNSQEISMHQSAFAGAVAGAVTRGVVQPLDVLKIRFQLQLEPISYGSKYSSILQATRSIIKEEGLSTLWSGHVPAQFLSVTYGILQFATFETLIAICEKSDSEFCNSHKHSVIFASGAIAASVATAISFPFDTIRTRLIAEQKTKKAYNGVAHAFHVMIKHEGWNSLFKGLLPTLGQIAPHAGIQFAVYKLFTDNILNKIAIFQRHRTINQPIESSLIANLIAGSISGFVAKTIIYPFDLTKKRLQIQGFQPHRKGFGRQMYCNGFLHCIKLIVLEEGFLALYKGLGPSILKAVLASALHFAVYDEIKLWLLKRVL